MKIGSEWKCGNCGKIYSTRELLELEHVKAVEGDTDPESQHGYVAVCTCGYRFHLDKWRLGDRVKIEIGNKEVNILVSTVDLELNHRIFEREEWYETGIFMDDEDENVSTRMIYEERYENKEDAMANHNRILELLKSGKFSISKYSENIYTINFEEIEK